MDFVIAEFDVVLEDRIPDGAMSQSLARSGQQQDEPFF